MRGALIDLLYFLLFLNERRQKDRFEPFAHEHLGDKFLQARIFLVLHTDALRRLAYARLREADAVFFNERTISIYMSNIFS